MEPAFANAGKTSGLEIWRIEEFKPVAYPKDQYGKFYTGDSYIVLFTKEFKGQLYWDIHFWLGAETSQDEAGTAAIFAVQLDDQLGGAPVQYREVQDHESNLFLSRFKNGVRYLPGGVKSGFSHVDKDAFVKRLFQVKGSRNIRVRQVDVSIKAMNNGDCFILDNGKTIFVYIGEKSKRIERLKAINAASQIRDQDHGGKSKVIIVDEYGPQSDYDDFFQALGGGSKDQVPAESAGGDDAKFETSHERIVTLYRVSDASGSLKVDLVAKKPLEQSMLDPNDCFILDTVDSNIYVWVGKKCTNKEKSESMNKAQHFLTTKNYPKWTHVQRVVEGGEPTAFTQYFKSWKGASALHSRLVRAESQENQAFDSRLFHAQIRPGSNQFTVEEVIDYDQEDLTEDDIMLLDIGKQVFVWVGKGASVKERTGAQNLAEKYLAKHHRSGVPVSIINQGEENSSFTEHFPKWNPSLWENVTSYQDIKAKIHGANPSV